MKANNKYILPVLVLAGSTLVLVLRCIAGPTVIIAPPAPPTIVVNPPAPVTVAVAPDYYVWDGYEYVGLVGDQYYYLGPGNVWIACDPARLERFHAWEKGHPDWRSHATHNVKYRNVDRAHAQPQPMHENQSVHRPAQTPAPAHDDQGGHSDHDHNGPPQ